jgi:hypothetical protein
VNFRAALVRKIVVRGLAVLLIAWGVAHFVFNRF